MGSPSAIANNLIDLAYVEFGEDRPEAAAKRLREALEYVAARSGEGVVWILEGAGAVALEGGDALGAARLLGAAAAVRESVALSETAYPPGEELRAHTAEAAREAVGDGAFAEASTAGAALSADAALAAAAEFLR